MRDATVVPSYLGVETRGAARGSEDQLLNFVLREGEVRKVFPFNHELNFSQAWTEYEIEVQHRDGLGIATSTLYRGVAANNSLGSQADYTHATYRADTSDSSNGIGNGSRVLVLCVNGDQSKAIILGGVPKKTEDGTHNYAFEFNGAKFTVNEDGEASFVHRGPTLASGEVKDDYEELEGASVVFDKRGSIVVSSHDEAQSVSLVQTHADDSQQNNSIQIKADKKFEVNCGGSTKVNTENNLDLNSNSGPVNIKAAQGVQVGDATDAWIKGTTYRTAEGALNKATAMALQSAATLLSSMSISLAAAATANAVPNGGAAAAPMFAAVATQMASLGGVLGSIAGSINSFEGSANQYLSTKNKAD